MSEQHTPGPWRAAVDRVETAQGLLVCRCIAAPNRSGARSAANAHLIAAAPEMLALLIESQTSIGGDWRDRRDALVRKAIEKEV